jgi:hypothetical protein
MQSDGSRTARSPSGIAACTELVAVAALAPLAEHAEGLAKRAAAVAMRTAEHRGRARRERRRRTRPRR